MPQTASPVPLHDVLHIRDTCLCFATQRAARRLARRFDAVFRPLGITNTQFSLMMPLNAPRPMTLSQLASFLGMDQTTMSAAAKALERAGLLTLTTDGRDRRVRRPALTKKGYSTLHIALPLWKAEHARLDAELGFDTAPLRHGLTAISAPAARA